MSAFASAEKESKIVQEIQGIKSNPCNCDGAGFGRIILKQGRESVTINSNDLSIQDNKLLVKVENKRKELATFDSEKMLLAQKIFNGEASDKNVPADLLTSVENISAKIITNKVNRKFEMMLCSHMGCLPFPHVEETFSVKVELKTLDGETVCFVNETYKSNGFTLGVCK